MPNSKAEPYVIIPDCQIINKVRNGFLVGCEHFPDKNRDGLKDQMWVHTGLMHPSAVLPPDVRSLQDDDEITTGDLVVLKRFVIAYDITEYRELSTEFIICPHCKMKGIPFADEYPVTCGNCGEIITDDKEPS